MDAPGIHPYNTIFLLQALLLLPMREAAKATRVLLAATWFISPSESIYLELGSSTQTMLRPCSYEKYPVLGTHFLFL